MRRKTIVILGAGVGGLVAANELRRRVPGEHRIVLVEKRSEHAFAPSFLWLMTGKRRPEEITRPLRSLVRPGVEVVHAEACRIDPANRQVETSATILHYDFLVIALGAELSPEALPGLSDSAQTFYTLEGSVRLWDRIRAFPGGRVVLLISSMPYKCPGAPYEGAMLLADFFRKRGLRDRVSFHLVTPEPQPLPVAGPALGEMVRDMLEERGIVYHPLHKVKEVSPREKELVFDGKEPIAYDLLVAVPPHVSPEVIRESGLGNETGWVPVDRATLATKSEGVYAIGDVTTMLIPGRWNPDVPLSLPKAGVFAHSQALVVTHRIAAEIAGTPAEEAFCGDGYCMLEAGADLAGFAYGNFFAEPSPDVRLRRIGRAWHVGKVLFERWWLSSHGARRESLRLLLTWGGKSLGIPISL